jgi:hypothetical protein
MSLTMSAMVAEPMPTPVEVERAARALGFEIRFDDPQAAFDAHAGFRPVTFTSPVSLAAGVEIYVGRAADLERDHSLQIDAQFGRVIWFRWGSSIEECLSALAICAALSALGGKVFSDEEGTFKTQEEIVAEAHEVMRFLGA